MIELNNVTLVVVTSVKIDQNIIALKKSMNGIKWGAIKFISHEKPEGLPDGVEFVKCEKITSIDKFSEFTFLELYKYIDTEFMILVHHDGYISRPELWDNEFLKYDYIGAPWEYSDNAYITDYGLHVDVGNGGFRLSSKKLLELPTKLGLKLEQRQGYYADDGNICVYHRRVFLEHGIKYAPVEVASKFSTEKWIEGISQEESFGFHGFIWNRNEKYR
jgi:hypothetical protein